MRAEVGGGWSIHHITDRTVELRKPSYEYRRFTGFDGVVVVRAEPGMDRAAVLNKAIEMAKQNDADLAVRITRRLVPSLQALADYTGKRVRVTQAFKTPEDPEIIGTKRV